MSARSNSTATHSLWVRNLIPVVIALVFGIIILGFGTGYIDKQMWWLTLPSTLPMTLVVWGLNRRMGDAVSGSMNLKLTEGSVSASHRQQPGQRSRQASQPRVPAP